jgi:Flp pilus assembly pilin Flp
VKVRGAKQLKMIKNFLKDESGMETLEYAVIAGLIAAVAVLVYATGWGTALSLRLNAATTTN